MIAMMKIEVCLADAYHHGHEAVFDDVGSTQESHLQTEVTLRLRPIYERYDDTEDGIRWQ